MEVIAQRRDRYSDKDPDPGYLLVNQSDGAALITGSGAEADLLLTNALAHLGENTGWF